MQTAYCFFDGQSYTGKLARIESYRFTNRDLDILEFILEMKFATIQEIHCKFFKVTRSGQESYSLRWARERLAALVKTKMLEPLKEVCHKTLYVLTQKGYFYLRNSRNTKTFCRPLYDVDGRTFDHDWRVIQLRIAFEAKGIAKEWVSERQLSDTDQLAKILSSEFRPDGIYTNESGQKVAFELEIARKSKERYRQKVKKYIQVMTEIDPNSRFFEKVHYVCEKQNIIDLLKIESQLYQPLFQFSLESNFLYGDTLK